MWLIKVVPCGSYEAATDRFVDVVKSTLESLARWVLRGALGSQKLYIHGSMDPWMYNF